MYTLGYYIDCDNAICIDCYAKAYGVSISDAELGTDYGSWPGFEGWEEPLVIFEDRESDSPTHCCECGVLIEHDLTDEGYRSVAEALGSCFQEGKQNPVVKQWIDYYGEWLDDVELPQADGVDIRDAIGLFFLLPIDKVWAERDDLRKHAVNAGWIE